MALAKFLGETYVVVGETLYSHEGTGVLSPVYLSRPMVVFVPPAGEPWTTWDIAGFPATYAQVVGPPVDDARPRIAERDAMIAALKAEVAEAQVQAAKLVEMYGSPHAAPAKPAGATKKAAAVKEKSDGDKSGA